MSFRITPVLRNVATRRVIVAGRAAPLLRRGYAEEAVSVPPKPLSRRGTC